MQRFHLRGAWLTAGAALTVVAGAGAVLAAAAEPEPVTVAPNANRHGTVLRIDGNPSALSARAESPQSIALYLPRGMRLDTRSRKRLCKPEEAAAVRCPRDSRIGFGHTVVHLSGYLFPGGETDAVSTLVAFLGTPPQSGGAAALVLQAKLQPERTVKSLQQAFGSAAPRTESSISGWIVPLSSGTYGLEIRFDGFPGGFTVPPPLSARVTRFKLALGAIRERKQTFYHRRKVKVLKGNRAVTRTVKIKDHRLISHHLLTNPRTCQGAWPYEVEVGFPSGTERRVGPLPCESKKTVSRVPPETPSAPQRPG
jgi:hypothetical protein